ncbi:hypothetical protein [Streptomyces sp. NPDC003393]
MRPLRPAQPGRRVGRLLALTGVIGRLASFELTVDDWRLLKNLGPGGHHRPVPVRHVAQPQARHHPVPAAGRSRLALAPETHRMLVAAWYDVIAVPVLTRFSPYWSSLL